MTTMDTRPMPPAAPSPRGNGKPLNIILAVLGGLVILTVLVGTARSAFAALNRNSTTQTASVEGVRGLQITAGSGSFELRFAKVDEAKLEVDSSNSLDWDLWREGTELVVSSPDSWGNWCFFGCGSYENTAVLTLPESMNDGSLDASFELAAGDFNAVGSYKNLDIEVGAGELDMSGAAQTAKVSLGAGRAGVSLEGVKQADFDISAGHLTGTLSGQAPQSITAIVRAGALELELPDDTYDLRQNVEAGDVNSLVATDINSPNKISVDISAGHASFYPQDSGPGPWDH